MTIKIINNNYFDVVNLIPDDYITTVIIDSPYNENKDFPNDNLSVDDFKQFTDKWISKTVPKMNVKSSLYCMIGEKHLFDVKHILDKHLIFRRLLMWNFNAGYYSIKRNYELRTDYVLFYTKTDDYIFNQLKESPAKSTSERWGPSADKDGNVPYEKLTPIFKKRYKQENYIKNPLNVNRGAMSGNVFYFNIPDIGNIFYEPRVTRGKNNELKFGRHPTQKPLKLIKIFIKQSSNENDVILDPMMGSGTTCVAAKQLNRQCIGVEIKKDFYKIAKNRIMDTCILQHDLIKEKRLW